MIEYRNSAGLVVELADADRLAEALQSRRDWSAKSAQDRSVYGYDPGDYAIEPQPEQPVIPGADPHASGRAQAVADFDREHPHLRRGALSDENARSEVLGQAHGRVTAAAASHANGRPVRTRSEPLEDSDRLTARMGIDPDGSGHIYRRNPHAWESQAAADEFRKQYNI